MGKEWELQFFFDEAYRRVIESSQYLRRIFSEIYQGGGEYNKRPDLRARESIVGEFIKEREIELKKVADYNLEQEEILRRMSWFDFNFHILALKKRRDEMEQAY